MQLMDLVAHLKLPQRSNVDALFKSVMTETMNAQTVNKICRFCISDNFLQYEPDETPMMKYVRQ